MINYSHSLEMLVIWQPILINQRSCNDSTPLAIGVDVCMCGKEKRIYHGNMPYNAINCDPMKIFKEPVCMIFLSLFFCRSE